MKKVMLLLVFVFLFSLSHSQTNSGKQEPSLKTKDKQKTPIVKNIKIKGQVRNSITQKPVQGAIIMIVGTSTGTITDPKGNFLIEVPEGAKQLSFSADKYSTLKMAIDTCKELKVNLAPKNK